MSDPSIINNPNAAETFNYYKLEKKQFNDLFEGNIETTGINNKSTFESLKASAQDGDLDCIDLLHNLALRNDEIGKKCENLLFDLFSGKNGSGKVDVDKDIQQASLKLYEIAQNFNGLKDDKKKFENPSKLLFMAGSASVDEAQKDEISKIFPKDTNDAENKKPWEEDRPLSTDDIVASTQSLDGEDLSINYPIALDKLADIVLEKMKNDPSDFLKKPELLVINTGGHWILFGLYKEQSDVKSFVFNSIAGLPEDKTQKLTEIAKMTGAPGIEFIDGNIQGNVSEGCGIFVVNAIQEIKNNLPQDPVKTLREFRDNFQKMSRQDQDLFNIQQRRQLYGERIEQVLRKSTSADQVNQVSDPALQAPGPAPLTKVITRPESPPPTAGEDSQSAKSSEGTPTSDNVAGTGKNSHAPLPAAKKLTHNKVTQFFQARWKKVLQPFFTKVTSSLRSPEIKNAEDNNQAQSSNTKVITQVNGGSKNRNTEPAAKKPTHNKGPAPQPATEEYFRDFMQMAEQQYNIEELIRLSESTPHEIIRQLSKL